MTKLVERERERERERAREINNVRKKAKSYLIRSLINHTKMQMKSETHSLSMEILQQN